MANKDVDGLQRSKVALEQAKYQDIEDAT